MTNNDDVMPTATDDTSPPPTITEHHTTTPLDVEEASKRKKRILALLNSTISSQPAPNPNKENIELRLLSQRESIAHQQEAQSEKLRQRKIELQDEYRLKLEKELAEQRTHLDQTISQGGWTKTKVKPEIFFKPAHSECGGK